MSVSVCLCPLLSVSVHFCPFLSVSVRFCPILSVSDHFCLFVDFFGIDATHQEIQCFPYAGFLKLFIYILILLHKGFTVQMELFERPKHWCMKVYLEICPIWRFKITLIQNYFWFMVILYCPLGLRIFAFDFAHTNIRECVVHLDWTTPSWLDTILWDF